MNSLSFSSFACLWLFLHAFTLQRSEPSSHRKTMRFPCHFKEIQQFFCRKISVRKPLPDPRNLVQKTLPHPCPQPCPQNLSDQKNGRKHWFGNWFGNWSEHWSENGPPNWSEKWSEHWRKNLGNLRRRPLGASRNMKHRISAAVADTKRKRAENVLWHTGT